VVESAGLEAAGLAARWSATACDRKAPTTFALIFARIDHVPTPNSLSREHQVIFELRVATRQLRRLPAVPTPFLIVVFDAGAKRYEHVTTGHKIADDAYQVEASVIAAGLDIETDRVVSCFGRARLRPRANKALARTQGFTG